ncbi:MAG: chemotaxis protein [Rhizobiales bacterium]|nr:chemotaxis protein [Hyphomicrobiales bacterium]
MTMDIGMMIEALVAVLLMLTIGYCITLNKRLKRLRADEQTLKATISELITATEIAERAIAGLKITVQECDAGLGQRLQSAERLSIDLAHQITNGEQVIAKIAQIVHASRNLQPATIAAAAAPDAHATVAAAQAFAARTRLRSQAA